MLAKIYEKRGLPPALARQVHLLGPGGILKRAALALEIGGLGVRLGGDGDELPSRHRHRARRPARNCGGQNIRARTGRRGDADDQACGRDEAIIRPKDCRTEPTEAVNVVNL